jgi:hypothetical protein
MANIWNTQTFLNSTWLINTVKLKLRDQFEQTWISLIDEMKRNETNRNETVLYKFTRNEIKQ